MAKSSKKTAAPNPSLENRAVLTVPADEEQMHTIMATTHTRSSISAARVIMAYTPKSGLDLLVLANTLQEHAHAAEKGDLSQAEAMLMNQAHALQAIFTRLAERAQGAEYINQMQTYLTLALKAQSQCRATLETLAAIKQPKPTAFIRQQNVAMTQQVNNGNDTLPRARENAKSTNGLLEVQDGERLDSGTTGTAGGKDPAVEAVGAIYRPDQ